MGFKDYVKEYGSYKPNYREKSSIKKQWKDIDDKFGKGKKEKNSDKKETGGKMESKRIDRYLGLNETEAHTYEQVKGVPQSFLDEAHNRYFEGNLEDFRSHFKTISEVAQFMSFVIENGMDVREIQKMLKILA